VLAVGFEKMKAGSLYALYGDRADPMSTHMDAFAKIEPLNGPPAPYMFGLAGREHAEKYGTTVEQFAMVAEKNHRHSANNPYAQFQDVYTLDEILASREIFRPLTKLQCSPTSDGSAAVVLAGEDFVEQHGLADRAVEISGQALVTDLESTFDGTAASLVGVEMTRKAARAVYDETSLGPEDFQVVELHDCFSTNELLTYEALGFCGVGEAGRLIEDGNTTYGGRWVVNPSGGLISKGHPLGATGLAQCTEMTWQVRGEAQKRQVPGVTAALQHNIGLGGAAVVTAYRRAAA
jgi:acetyl-CoA acetyltransferase